MAADRVKDVATGEAERIKAITTEAVKSQAYLYPIKVCPHWLRKECSPC